MKSYKKVILQNTKRKLRFLIVFWETFRVFKCGIIYSMLHTVIYEIH